MSGRTIFTIIVLVFAAVLAVVIGSRMGSEAMAVVIGVTCGVVASIPMSAIMLVVGNRNDRRSADYSRPQDRYPPVVVINPSDQRQQRYLYPSLPYQNPSMADAAAPRAFRIIGDD